MIKTKMLAVALPMLVVFPAYSFAGSWCNAASAIPNIADMAQQTPYSSIGNGLEITRTIGKLIFCALGW